MGWLSKNNSNNESLVTAKPQKSQLSVADYCEYGQKLLDEGKPSQALEYYQAAIEFDKDNVVALYGLMTVYKMTGKTDKADNITQRLEALSEKDLSTIIPSSQEQLENEKRRYMHLLYTLLKIETDEFGLKHGRYSSEDNAVLLACEDSIHKLENSLGKSRTDFNKLRDGVYKQYTSKPSQIQSVIDQLYRKYEKICKAHVIEENGVYTISGEATALLTKIEDNIEVLNSRLHHKTDNQIFLSERNRAISKYIKSLVDGLFNEYRCVCNDGVDEIDGVYGYSDDTILQLKEIEQEIRSLDPQLAQQTDKLVSFRDNAVREKLKSRYIELVKLNLVKCRNEEGGTHVVSDKVLLLERSLRSQIVSIMGDRGNEWCDEQTKKLIKGKEAEEQKEKEESLKALKISGVVIGVIAAAVLLVFAFKYIIWGIIVLGAVLGGLSGKKR